MKIVLTGSLGNISKPLAEKLILQGHSVLVISSSTKRKKEIEDLGAIAAIGLLDDAEFLTRTFTEADAVYCMIPPNYSSPDVLEYYREIGKSYAAAIQESGVKRVLLLSSYGAHLDKGTGFIVGSHLTETIFEGIPDISLTFIRPTSFYYNFFEFIPMIKQAGFIGGVYGGEDQLAMVSPTDIATSIAEEINKLTDRKKVVYVCSDDRTCNEVAKVLGRAIGIPDLKWITLPQEQVLKSLKEHGMSEDSASNLVELGTAIHTGLLREDFDKDIQSLGNVKLEEFAEEFAAKYRNQQ